MAVGANDCHVSASRPPGGSGGYTSSLTPPVQIKDGSDDGALKSTTQSVAAQSLLLLPRDVPTRAAVDGDALIKFKDRA